MRYVPHYDALMRRGAILVDKILRGAKPMELLAVPALKFALVAPASGSRRAPAFGVCSEFGIAAGTMHTHAL
jgi:hypothetical protein